jgi:hypothetical protein
MEASMSVAALETFDPQQIAIMVSAVAALVTALAHLVRALHRDPDPDPGKHV